MANVPLVRTEGKAFAGGATLTADRLAREATLLRASKTDLTRQVERDFGLGDCLYFYAGHACPDFGDVVFVFDPDWSESAVGSATPFDTGGVYAGKILATDIHAVGAAARSYVDQHLVALRAWQKSFAAYVTDYFKSPQAYVTGEAPLRDDPSGRLLNPANKRRAWTWEVRVHRDHPACSHLRLLCITTDFAEQLRVAVLALPPDEARVWHDVLDARTLFVPATSEPAMVAQLAEGRIVEWL